MSAPSKDQAELNERFELAKSLYNGKQYNESRAAFRELTASSDYAAKGFYGLGLVDFALGNRDGAAANFRTVLSHDPTEANSLFYLGLIAEQQGRAQEAQTLYRMALASNPQHVAAKGRFDRLQQPQSTNADAPQRGSPRPPVATQEVDQDIRAKWRDWVKSEIGGADARIEAATIAALTALQRQGPEAAIAAARQAAFRWGQDEFRRFPQPDDGKVIRGRVKGIQPSQARVDGAFTGRGMSPPVWKIMNFQIERVTSDGTPLPSVPVQLRGRWLEGALANGDIVEVNGPWTTGQVLAVNYVRSAQVSEKTLIRVRGDFFWNKVFGWFFVLIFLVVASVIFASFASK
jgi:tetratricopeptide (TPR) repeat protein